MGNVHCLRSVGNLSKGLDVGENFKFYHYGVFGAKNRKMA